MTSCRGRHTHTHVKRAKVTKEINTKRVLTMRAGMEGEDDVYKGVVNDECW